MFFYVPDLFCFVFFFFCFSFCLAGLCFFLGRREEEVVTSVPISISLPTEIYSFHEPSSSSQHGAPHDAKAFALERTN